MKKSGSEKRELGKEERRLEVRLTEEEKVQAGKDLAGSLQAITEAELELAAIKQTFKGRIEGHQAEVSMLAHMVNKGTESRPVECVWFAANERQKILVRPDTG